MFQKGFNLALFSLFLSMALFSPQVFAGGSKGPIQSIDAKGGREAITESFYSCLDLNSPASYLVNSAYQGRPSNPVVRDIFTGVYCEGEKAKLFFERLGLYKYKIHKGEDQLENLISRAELWDSGKRVTSFFLMADSVDTGTQVACYGVVSRAGDDFSKHYCHIVSSINAGLSKKIQEENRRRFFIDDEALLNRLGDCWKGSRVISSGNGAYLECGGVTAQAMFEALESGKMYDGTPYAFEEDDLDRRALGTPSAIIYRDGQDARIVMGERRAMLGSQMLLNKNSRCEREDGEYRCVFLVGPASEADFLLDFAD